MKRFYVLYRGQVKKRQGKIKKIERLKQTLYNAYIKSEKSLESVLEFMEN